MFPLEITDYKQAYEELVKELYRHIELYPKGKFLQFRGFYSAPSEDGERKPMAKVGESPALLQAYLLGKKWEQDR